MAIDDFVLVQVDVCLRQDLELLKLQRLVCERALLLIGKHHLQKVEMQDCVRRPQGGS